MESSNPGQETEGINLKATSQRDDFYDNNIIDIVYQKINTVTRSSVYKRALD